jgi:DNA-binding transcriptional regulator WhiA
LLFGRKYTRFGIELTTENEDVMRFASRLLAEFFNITAEPVKLGKKKLRLNINDPAEARRILETYSSSRPGGRMINYAVLDSCTQSGKPEEAALQIPADYDHQEEEGELADSAPCYRAFLAGAFLSCGSIGEPQRQYHLEFAVPFPRLADSLARYLEELGFSAKQAKRGDHRNIRVLYFKDNERIADLLGLMGAVECSLDLADVAIEKTLRNKVNRQTNSDTANLNRAAAAAVRQLYAVRLLEQRGLVDELPAALREAAALRRANPEASLSELCIIAPGISRSSLYTRLKKLEALAENPQQLTINN